MLYSTEIWVPLVLPLIESFNVTWRWLISGQTKETAKFILQKKPPNSFWSHEIRLKTCICSVYKNGDIVRKHMYSNSVVSNVNVNTQTQWLIQAFSLIGESARLGPSFSHFQKVNPDENDVHLIKRRNVRDVYNYRKKYAQFVLCVFWIFVTMFLFKVTLFELVEKEKAEMPCDQPRYFLWTSNKLLMVLVDGDRHDDGYVTPIVCCL